MNQGKYVFNQLTDFLLQRVFDRLVEKYDGNKYVKFFLLLEPIILYVVPIARIQHIVVYGRLEQRIVDQMDWCEIHPQIMVLIQ